LTVGAVAGAEQVYRYDAGTGRLARVSVGVRGFDDDGNAAAAGARIVTQDDPVGQPRRDPSMSDDGGVVFFQSPAGLTPDALNDVPVNATGGLAQNVYEWEADGVRGCGEAAGCVYLISDGRDVTEGGGSESATASSVELLGSDATGDDVFFMTADALVPGDTNSQIDYYDARVDGGFPAPPQETACEGGACRGAGSEPSLFAPFASSTLLGSANLGSMPGGGPGVSKTAERVRLERLARALEVCHRDKRKRKRVACETAARKRYAPPHKATKKAKRKAKKAKRAERAERVVRARKTVRAGAGRGGVA